MYEDENKIQSDGPLFLELINREKVGLNVDTRICLGQLLAHTNCHFLKKNICF